MSASGARTGKVPGDFIEIDIPVVHLEQQMRRTLQPGMQAAQAGCFKRLAFIQIPKGQIGQPTHQKSSALGMRVKAIFPPVNPPGGGVQSPSVTTRFPNREFSPSIACVSVSQRWQS